MKKIVTAFLLLSVAAWAVHAEFKVGWTFDFGPTLYRLEAPLGDFTSATLKVPTLNPDGTNGEMMLVDDWNENYRGSRWEMFTGGGQFGGLPWNRGTENRIRLSFEGESYQVYARIRADQILSNLMRASNPSDVGIFHFISNATFDDWFVRGNLGMFRAVVGNYDQRGRTPEYVNFHEFTRNRQDFFGVHLPSARITPSVEFEFLGVSDSTESTNLRASYKHGNSDYRRDGSNAFWLFEAGFEELLGQRLFLEVFGDMADMTRSIGTGMDENGRGWNRINGGVRVSGVKLADMITFDLMYRLKGGDPSSFSGYTEREDPDNPGDIINNGYLSGIDKQPDGRGRILNHFGLYGNVDGLVDGLGISLGYTGMVRSFEKHFQFSHTGIGSGVEIPNRELTFQGPFFSGIDLRASYSAIENVGITLHHNTTFASAKGTDINSDTTTKFVVKLLDADNAMGPMVNANGRVTGAVLGLNESEKWLALYNAIAFTYKLAGNTTAFFNFAYRYGALTQESMEDDKDPASATVGNKNKAASTVFSSNDLMGVLGVTHMLSPQVTLHGGVSLRYLTVSQTFGGAYHGQAQVMTQDRSEGTLTVAVPLWMRVQF